MQIKSFRFNLQELGGALGDLGTLLPLMVALILVNGLNTTSVLLGVGLFYIGSGLYFHIPMPVQPLKAAAAVAISLGLSSSIISAAGLLMGLILLLLAFTNLINYIIKLFPQAVVRGIQLSIGLTLLQKGVEFAFSKDIFITGTSRVANMEYFPFGIILAIAAGSVFILFQFVFFKQEHHFPASLALLTLGLGVGIVFGPLPQPIRFNLALPDISLPSATDLWLAFTLLVIPQLPLTLGNAVVGTSDTAKVYFKEQPERTTPRALTISMGVANLAAGLMGAMPMCHGSGGLTAHYKLGARTGGANLMIGGLLLAFGLLLGSAALAFFSLIPLSVLGVLLVSVGVYHAFLIRDLRTKSQFIIAGTVAAVTILLGNLAYGFASGILLYHLLKRVTKTV